MKAADPNTASVFVDSDNALGAPFGDVDDGFALAALIRSDLKVEALSTVFGNTFEPLVYRNTSALAKVCHYQGPILRGAATWWAKETESSRHLSSIDRSTRVVALGPLTNVASALNAKPTFSSQVTELICVTTNLNFSLPAFRFIDFNQWKDAKATRKIFDSEIPLTCVPCDVARKLRVTRSQVSELPGEIGKHLQKHSRRWFLRSRLLKGVRSVPIWDLAAAMYAIEPKLFQVRETRVKLGRLGEASYDGGSGRPVRVVVDFDSSAVWARFVALLTQATS